MTALWLIVACGALAIVYAIWAIVLGDQADAGQRADAGNRGRGRAKARRPI